MFTQHLARALWAFLPEVRLDKVDAVAMAHALPDAIASDQDEGISTGQEVGSAHVRLLRDELADRDLAVGRWLLELQVAEGARDRQRSADAAAQHHATVGHDARTLLGIRGLVHLAQHHDVDRSLAVVLDHLPREEHLGVADVGDVHAPTEHHRHRHRAAVVPAALGSCLRQELLVGLHETLEQRVGNVVARKLGPAEDDAVQVLGRVQGRTLAAVPVVDAVEAAWPVGPVHVGREQVAKVHREVVDRGVGVLHARPLALHLVASRHERQCLGLALFFCCRRRR